MVLEIGHTSVEQEFAGFQRKADTTRELDPRVAVSCPDTQRPTAFGTFIFDQTRASAV